MVEGEVAREGKPNGHNGKPLQGGITMQKNIQVLCTLSQKSVDAIPNKEPSTTWIYAITRLHTVN